MQRPIIEIDEDKCNGCGQCILDCAEGALAIVNGKAKLVSDIYCDGLGACLSCPQGALALITRDAPAFDEKAALEARAQREKGSPGAPRLFPLPDFNAERRKQNETNLAGTLRSALPAWPIQLLLLPPRANFLAGADLLLAAHCSGFAVPQLHQDWLQGRVPVIACPKLEDNAILIEKLAQILKNNDISSITALRMSVPCCNLEKIARAALKTAGRHIPWTIHTVAMH